MLHRRPPYPFSFAISIEGWLRTTGAVKPLLTHCKACKTVVANASKQGFGFRKPTLLLTIIRLNFSLFYSINHAEHVAGVPDIWLTTFREQFHLIS
jgi:hypothetical protein